MASLLGCEIVSIYATHQLVVWSGLHIPPALVLGFAITRPVKRLRLPLDLAATVALAKLVPALTELKLAQLAKGVMPSQLPPAISNTPMYRIGERALAWLGVQQIEQVINRYGACYFIGARLAGVCTVSSVSLCLAYGIDLQPAFHFLGVSDQVTTTVASWAAAVVLSSALYPLSMGLGAIVVAPRVNAYLVKSTKWRSSS